MPTLLDLFCGAGGAAMGYYRAGFDDIVGIDNQPQPNYPFAFIQADALQPPVDLGAFDLIHASPPCQSYSALKGLSYGAPTLIDDIRGVLWGRESVIENVIGAPLYDPIRLCGSSFGLGVRRHRIFETSMFSIALLPPCHHAAQPEPIDVTGSGGPFYGKRRTGGGGVSRKPRNVAHAQEVMGINWMTRSELSEAIPPAYTEYIGTTFLEQHHVA